MDMLERVFNAADILESQGKSVTLASIRAVLGGGSFSTINPILQKWKNRKIASSQLPPAPEDLSNRMFSLTTELWNQAIQISESRLASDRLVFEEQISSLREDLKEATSAADRAVAGRDSDVLRIKELEESLTAAKAERDTTAKNASEAEIRFQQSERRVSDMQSQIERLDRQNTELSAKNTELTSVLMAKASIVQGPQDKKIILKPKSQGR